MKKDKNNYEAYGKEWEAEMMKMRKADIIQFYKKALISNQVREIESSVYTPIAANTTVFIEAGHIPTCTFGTDVCMICGKTVDEHFAPHT